MTLGQQITIGPFHFPVLRILIFVGFMRTILRNERPSGGLCEMDRLMVFWALWMLFSSAFHQPFQAALVYRLGLVYNALGIYFLIRCFCREEADVLGLTSVIAILLLPVAFAMLNEQLTQRNLFSIFGGVPEFSQIREGNLRSQGPFGHPILAGTVGAVCFPLMLGIWRKNRLMAIVGFAGCLLIVITSHSSGPLMSLFVGIFGVLLWRWRHLTRQMRLAAGLGYILLDLVMKDPAYYLMARIDLAGGSTGWYRARLIQSAFIHLGEWWWAGSDYTRHWMPTGVSWSPDHADIVNYYISMGVTGGLPLMLLFILIIWKGFKYVGEALSLRLEEPVEDRFIIWTLGATLFTFSLTSISVSYFDQSFIFLYLTLGIISSLRSVSIEESAIKN
jgi:hypothetical protein